MYNPKTGKGLGNLYSAKHRAMKHREWKGFRDTAYDFFHWLKCYLFMAAKLGVHPILVVKAMLRYRWMISYLTATNMIDRHTIGLRGRELRYVWEELYALVRNATINVRDIIIRDEHLRPKSKQTVQC